MSNFSLSLKPKPLSQPLAVTAHDPQSVIIVNSIFMVEESFDLNVKMLGKPPEIILFHIYMPF